MPDASTFALFFVAALVLLVIPGPSVLYIVARSIEGGRTAGLVSVLGVQTGALVHVAVEPAPPSRVFSQGVIVNTLNPKTALFFLAFLPQFVDPARGAAWTQILLLGAIFVTLALCTDGLYALLSGTAGE